MPNHHAATVPRWCEGTGTKTPPAAGRKAKEIEMTTTEKFTVAVGRSTTMQCHPSPDDTCGHNHKSIDAAYRCQEKLMNWSKDRKTCSAKWYSSFICEVTPDGYRRI